MLPYDDDDSIKDVVGVSQVAKGAERRDLEDHLQREHAGEDDVADLQNICELLWLTKDKKKRKTLTRHEIEEKMKQNKKEP